MELFLTVHRPVAQEDIGDVADVAIVDPRRVRAADDVDIIADRELFHEGEVALGIVGDLQYRLFGRQLVLVDRQQLQRVRSEEPTSELQSLMRISYAVFCLKK